MKNLIINATQLSPQVLFNVDNNQFEISGESVPENASEFYKPVIQWLKDYGTSLHYSKNESGKARKVSMHFKYDYFNSTSAKFILDIFFVMQKLATEGHDVEVCWHYESGDTDMQEAGMEFSGLCPGLPFKTLLKP